MARLRFQSDSSSTPSFSLQVAALSSVKWCEESTDPVVDFAYLVEEIFQPFTALTVRLHEWDVYSYPSYSCQKLPDALEMQLYEGLAEVVQKQ